jgi:hypothetical protein
MNFQNVRYVKAVSIITFTYVLNSVFVLCLTLKAVIVGR